GIRATARTSEAQPTVRRSRPTSTGSGATCIEGMFSRAIARVYSHNPSGCQMSPDLVGELADADRLLEVAVEAVSEKPLAVALHRRGGECDHADRGRALVLPQLSHRLGPVQVGHADVHQDEIGAVFASE